MASENPGRIFGLNKGKIEKGYDADIIFTDEDFNVEKVFVCGDEYVSLS